MIGAAIHVYALLGAGRADRRIGDVWRDRDRRRTGRLHRCRLNDRLRPHKGISSPPHTRGPQVAQMISLVVGILTAFLVGAILFWATDNYCPNRRLAQILKLLVVLACLASIVNRLLPMLGYPS